MGVAQNNHGAFHYLLFSVSLVRTFHVTFPHSPTYNSLHFTVQFIVLFIEKCVTT